MKSRACFIALFPVAFAAGAWAQTNSGIANNVVNGNYIGRVSVNIKVAASFSGVRGAITGLTVNLSKHGAPGGDVLVELRDSSYDGTVLASATVGGGQIPTGSYADFNVSFPRAELVSADSWYNIVFSKTGGADDSNYYIVGCGNSGSVFGEVSSARWAVLRADGWNGYNILGAPKISFTVLPAGTPPASVQMSTSSFEFGSINVGSTAQRVLRIRNVGGSPLTVNGISSNLGEFTFAPAVPPSATVAVGDSLSVTVSFAPTSAGSRNGTLTISHNAPGATSTVALTGAGVVSGGSTGGGTTGGDSTGGGGSGGTTTPGVSAPGVAITPLTLEMDSTVVGYTTQKTFVVRNDSAVTLHVTGVAVAGANTVDFSVMPGNATVESTGSRTFIVSFTPSGTGARQAEIRLTHDATGGVSTIPVSGRGVGAPSAGVGPQIGIAPTSIMFDTTAVGSFDYATVTVSNGGTATLYVTGIVVTGRDPSQFAVSPTTFNVLPGGSNSFTVTFRPGGFGDKEAVVVVGSNAASNAVSIPVRGTTPIDRRHPTVSLSASVTRGVAPLTVRLTNHNSGGAVSRWEWGMDERTPESGMIFIIRSSFGDTLTYTYTRPGVYDPRLSLDGPGGGDSRTLSESSARDPIVVLAPQPPAPILFVDVDSLNLGAIDVGASATSSFRVSNRGNALLSARLGVDGDNSFVIVSADTLNVAADTSDIRTVTVRFLPLSAGTKTGRLLIRYNGDPGTRSVVLSGIARAVAQPVVPVVPRPVFASTVNSVDAGSIAVNRGRSQMSFVVRNTGTAFLTTNVFYRGSQAFAVTPDSMAIAPGASDSVRIAFAPTAAGLVSGRIYFSHNAGTEPFVVGLSGTGVPYAPSAQAADFNGDGQVGFEDFFLLSEELNLPEEGRNANRFDLSGDGAVNLDDFFFFGDFFGQSVPG